MATCIIKHYKLLIIVLPLNNVKTWNMCKTCTILFITGPHLPRLQLKIETNSRVG